uniref:Putative ovule protein n=1 Tax=Solanum chacoense TaxID=4108 RepID=A0A0V0GUG8_SOLCH
MTYSICHTNHVLETLFKTHLFLKEIVLKLLKTLLEISVSSQLKCENTYKLLWEILSSLITCVEMNSNS